MKIYRDKVIEITISWSCEFQCTETNIIERLVIDAKSLIGIFDELMNAQSRVIWLDNCVRDFRRRYY